MMKSFFLNVKVLALVLVVVLLTGCGDTRITGVWKKSDFVGQPFQFILVVGLTKDERDKNIWEDIMADQLKQNGVMATTSTQCFPQDNDITKDEILNYVKDKGMDAVLVTRLVDTKEEKAYYPPTSVSYYGGGYYGGARHRYYNNFGSYYDTVYMPGYTTTYTTVILETNLYDAASQELVWSMSSDTFDPASSNKLSESVSKKVVQALQQDNLIRSSR